MARKGTQRTQQVRHPIPSVFVQLRASTRAALLFCLGLLSLFKPIGMYNDGTDLKDIDADRVEWTCPSPFSGISSSVDVDALRAEIAASPPGEKVSAEHPSCSGTSWAQIVFGVLLIGGAGYISWKSWQKGSDGRAEKKFKKLQQLGSGKSTGLFG
jgi:hypothetical protein